MTGSVLDRLFDAVGGDVFLHKLLVNKYRDFIGFSGEISGVWGRYQTLPVSYHTVEI